MYSNNDEKGNSESSSQGLRNSPIIYRGMIKNYLENTYGFIQVDGHSDVFFHINQVNDSRLRYILSHGEGIGQFVNFKLGDNSLNGRGVAGDDIQLCADFPFATVASNSNVHYKGYIIYYNRFDHYGKLQGEDNKDYTFKARNIVDPFLRTYLEEGHVNGDWQVEYSLRIWNGMTHANDIVSIQEIPSEMFDEWKRNMVITERDIMAWESYKNRGNKNLSNDGMEDGIYIPLQPIREQEATQISSARILAEDGATTESLKLKRSVGSELQKESAAHPQDNNNSQNIKHLNGIHEIVKGLCENHPPVKHDLSLIKKSLKASGAFGWDRVYSMFDAAVKSNAIITDKDKQNKLCNECDEILKNSPECKPIHILKGHILFLIGKREESSNSFLKGEDYYNEALVCAERTDETRLLAVLSDIVRYEKFDDIKKLFGGESVEPISEFIQYIKENPISDEHREQIKVSAAETESKVEALKHTNESKVTLQDVYRMFFSSDEPNPFRNLPKIEDDEDYYKEACLYLFGDLQQGIDSDLELAESLFIKSLQNGHDEILGGVIANLVNIYARWGGEYIKKGLQLLDEFGYFIDNVKLRNLLNTLITTSKNEEAVCKFYLYVIDNIEASNDKADYIPKLMYCYFRMRNWEDTAHWAEQGIRFIEGNETILQENKVLLLRMRRILSIALYELGKKDDAKKVAKDVILEVPNDYVAEQILNDYFQLENDASEEVFVNDQITSSVFMNVLLNRTGVFDILSKDVKNKRQIRSHIQENHYTAPILRVTEDNHYLMKEVLPQIEETDKSDLFLAMARIQLDAIRNVHKSQFMGWVRFYFGLAMVMRGDNVIRANGHTDSAAFYYTEGLRHLNAESPKVMGEKFQKTESKTQQNYRSYPSKAFHHLIWTFFGDKERFDDNYNESDIFSINDSFIATCFVHECRSVSSFVVALFRLNHIGNYEQIMLRKIYENERMQSQVLYFLNTILGTNEKVQNLMDFERVWGNARIKVAALRIELINEIQACVEELSMNEGTKSHIRQLEKFSQTHIFNELDEVYLQKFIRLVKFMDKNRNLERIDEYIRFYRNIINELSILNKGIDEKPTDLGFNVIRDCSENLITKTEENLNNLYAATKPEIINIALVTEKFFVKANMVLLSIIFANERSRQTADSIKIQFTPEEGVVQHEILNKFGYIRGGEQQEAVAKFKLTDDIIEKKEFSLDVKISYSYYDGVGSSKSETREEHLIVKLNERNSFKLIDNRYRKIWRKNGVQEPDMFKGRDKLIDEICASMDLGNGEMIKNRGIILWGQRRVGKSSVRNYLMNKIQNVYPGVYIPIDIKSVGKFKNVKDLFRGIVIITESEFKNHHPDIYKRFQDFGIDGFAIKNQWIDDYMFLFGHFMTQLTYILEDDVACNKNIPLFFFDEFSDIYTWIQEKKIDGTEFMHFWKSFIGDYGICAIIVMHDNFPIWSNEYPNEFSCMDFPNQITYLDFEGTRDLVCDPCTIMGRSIFSREAVDYIYRLTQGSAYLIVILCKAVIDYVNENGISLVTKAVMVMVLETKFVNQEFINNKNIFEQIDFDPQLGDALIIDGERREVTAENTRLLKEIARRTIAHDNVSINEIEFLQQDKSSFLIFNRLQQRGVITKEDTFCAIAMPILKFYLLKMQDLMTRDILLKL